MSKQIPFTLLEICNEFSNEPKREGDSNYLSRAESRVLIEGLKTLAQINLVQAINSSFILMKRMETAGYVYGDYLVDEIIAPNLGRVIDGDLNDLREIAAKTVSFTAELFADCHYSERRHALLIQELAQVFQALSRTKGQEGQMRELADHFVRKFLDGEYSDFGAHNNMSDIDPILPFTTAGQISISTKRAAKKSPKNRK